ncbi:ribosomal protein L7/L12 [Clostridium sp. CF012]|uniref:ribosomal protein L7/L12 n=1 Tax=Clostridium sp. CF012 TaxID=2843319 RepID=UPI001C0ADBC4|nr:ribosomal protein L7/L12 [Clostridium sp. CF012]MBU3146294.1 ribosomal protein L7/L12 [Clostridium sp. CF012]
MDDNIIWIIIGVLLLSSILTGINQLRNDIKRTNKVLEKIAKQIGVPETAVDDEIKSLVIDGKKIKAIKMYRQTTGLGLKEAKEQIDLLSEKLKK